MHAYVFIIIYVYKLYTYICAMYSKIFLSFFPWQTKEIKIETKINVHEMLAIL